VLLQFVLTGPLYNTEQVLTLMTNDFNSAPVYTASLDEQGAFSQSNYIVDQSCSSLTFIGSIVQALYEWIVKVRTGNVPLSTTLASGRKLSASPGSRPGSVSSLSSLSLSLGSLDLGGPALGTYMAELLELAFEPLAAGQVSSTGFVDNKQPLSAVCWTVTNAAQLF
jgi:hypothetical protein